MKAHPAFKHSTGTAMHRTSPGIHILVAQAQWERNQKKDALRTICR